MVARLRWAGAHNKNVLRCLLKLCSESHNIISERAPRGTGPSNVILWPPGYLGTITGGKLNFNKDRYTVSLQIIPKSSKYWKSVDGNADVWYVCQNVILHM